MNVVNFLSNTSGLGFEFPTYVIDLAVILLLLFSFLIGCLLRSKFLIISMVIFSVLLVGGYFIGYPYLDPIINENILKLIPQLQNATSIDLGGMYVIDITSLDNAANSLYSVLVNLAYNLGQSLSLDKATFIANIDVLVEAVVVICFVLIAFVGSFVLTLIIYIILKIIGANQKNKKNKPVKKNSILVGGVLNFVFFGFVLTTILYLINNAFATVDVLSKQVNVILLEIDSLSASLVDYANQLNVVVEDVNEFLSQYEYVLGDLTNSILDIESIFTGIQNSINTFIGPESDLMVMIDMIHGYVNQLGTLTNLVTDINQNMPVSNFLGGINYGFFNVTIDGNTLTYAENLDYTLTSLTGLVTKPVNEIKNGIDGIIEFCDDYLGEMRNTLALMGK